MVSLNFVTSDGNRYSVEAEAGCTVMEAAIQNRVPGIDADCGGACACATCHVYVGESWLPATGTASPMEEDMLDFASDVRAGSRLSCQIMVQPSLDGLEVEIPQEQG